MNAAGQTVRRVTDRRGNLLEVVTDSANRNVSTRRLSGGTATPPRQR